MHIFPSISAKMTLVTHGVKYTLFHRGAFNEAVGSTATA